MVFKMEIKKKNNIWKSKEGTFGGIIFQFGTFDTKYRTKKKKLWSSLK